MGAGAGEVIVGLGAGEDVGAGAGEDTVFCKAVKSGGVVKLKG
jgi:hypothetical protein